MTDDLQQRRIAQAIANVAEWTQRLQDTENALAIAQLDYHNHSAVCRERLRVAEAELQRIKGD